MTSQQLSLTCPAARVRAALTAACLIALLGLPGVAGAHAAADSAAALPPFPPAAPALQNGRFECDDGYAEEVNGWGKTIRYPQGWTLVQISGQPALNSTRMEFERQADRQNGTCYTNRAFVERLEGRDSLVIFAQDIESTAQPGKPFDMALYQRVAVTPGGHYSASGWFTSLCGGSNSPNDCPQGHYMAKMLGIDPTGGTDPTAPTVVWSESRAPHTEARWVNLRLGVVAQAAQITLFVRVNSPFQWHGNHAFIDAVSLVRAPVAELDPLPASVEGDRVALNWQGAQSPDVAAVGGTYRLYFDVQARPEGGGWSTVAEGAGTGGVTYTPPGPDAAYEFRVRARAEQPEGGGGVSPNHRYPGAWSAAQRVYFDGSGGTIPAQQQRLYLPSIARQGGG